MLVVPLEQNTIALALLGRLAVPDFIGFTQSLKSIFSEAYGVSELSKPSESSVPISSRPNDGTPVSWKSAATGGPGDGRSLSSPGPVTPSVSQHSPAVSSKLDRLQGAKAMSASGSFAVAVCTVDGQQVSFGDIKHRFPIMETVSPLLYSLVLRDCGPDETHKVSLLLQKPGFRRIFW